MHVPLTSADDIIPRACPSPIHDQPGTRITPRQPLRRCKPPRHYPAHNTPNTYHFSAQYVKTSCHPAAPPSRHETGQRHVPGLTIAIYDRPKLTENPQDYIKMSGWGLGWFGGGQTKKEAPKKAILQLRGQLEMLNKREKHLQNQMDEQDVLARKHVSTNKQGTLPSSR
jgi:hypothetical protein